MSEVIINCPKCGEQVNISKALDEAHASRYQEEYNKKIQSLMTTFNAQKQAMEEKEKELSMERAKIEQARLEEQKRIEEVKESIKKDMQKKLELQQAKAELALEQERVKIQRQVEEEAKERARKEALEAVEKAKEEAKKAWELEKLELTKKLDDAKQMANELKAKTEQGSMQLQGEVLEIAVEESLKRLNPHDIIEEVPKGFRGADCVQKIMTRSGDQAGVIVYETKRTKHFTKEWVNKLKDDALKMKADTAILVTEVMPLDMPNFGNYHGVWVCTYRDFESVSMILRSAILKMHSVKKMNENKADKAVMMYEYFTGVEFSSSIQRVVEMFSEMKTQLEAEKRAMTKIWKAREKYIDTTTQNLLSISGSIKGIAGNNLPDTGIKELEMLGESPNIK